MHLMADKSTTNAMIPNITVSTKDTYASSYNAYVPNGGFGFLSP